MKRTAMISVTLLLVMAYGHGQSTHDNFRNYPIVVTLYFHSLSMPFKNLKSNFSNVGIGIGTEVSHNGRQNWVQQFNVAWFRNKGTGNALFINTKTAWRPTLVSDLYSGLELGAGYMIALRPTMSYRQQHDKWVPVGKKGKGLFAIPVGISVGYNDYSENTYLVPHLGYDLMLLRNYNKSIPIMPQSVWRVGTRIHLQD